MINELLNDFVWLNPFSYFQIYLQIKTSKNNLFKAHVSPFRQAPRRVSEQSELGASTGDESGLWADGKLVKAF